MSEDARFEDGVEPALRLRAETPDDLTVISALIQDAVGGTADIAWTPKRRRFAMLLNRFRWEDAPAARRQNRRFERVRSLLVVENALATRSNGLDPRDRDLVLSVLALDWRPAEDGAGTLTLVLAGDGEIAIEAEWLDVSLTDVTRPHLARAKVAPAHRDA